MIAIRVVRPGVTVLRSGERSNSFHDGLNLSSVAFVACGFLYGDDGVERKNEMASSVPYTKFASCCDGTPGHPDCSPAGGFEEGAPKRTSPDREAPLGRVDPPLPL